MGKTDDLIKSVLADKKLSGEKVYSDEPLIFTASQMKNYTPPEYTEMKRIISGRDNIYMPSNRIFYKQAKFMENFRDNFDYQGEFIRYYPTYRDMNTYQLRGYFSWRTDLRDGKIKKTALAFAFVYLYELINSIGVTSHLDGFEKLKFFSKEYGKLDKRILAYANKWLIDYAVYHNLDPALLKDLPELSNDAALVTLMNYRNITPNELLIALDNFSSYKLHTSAFYKKNPDEVADTVYKMFCILADYYDKKSGGDIFIRLFGKPYKEQYFMFYSAVFYEKYIHKDCIYKINDVYKYTCKSGNWTTERFYAVRDKAGKLGSLLKSLDFYLRSAYNYKSTLKNAEISSVFENAIRNAIGEHFKEKREREKAVISIDVSKLKSIRSTAEITRDKLIIEEEAEEEPIIIPEIKDESGLDSTLKQILQSLIKNENAEATARKNGIMLSLAVDKINDTLFDRFGDTVIIYNGDTPEVIEDYLDELKGMLNI